MSDSQVSKTAITAFAPGLVSKEKPKTAKTTALISTGSMRQLRASKRRRKRLFVNLICKPRFQCKKARKAYRKDRRTKRQSGFPKRVEHRVFVSEYRSPPGRVRRAARYGAVFRLIIVLNLLSGFRLPVRAPRG